MKNILFIYVFLIGNFFTLFRYVRANRSILYFPFCLLFLGFVIYVAKNISILLTSLLVLLGLLEIYVAFLKERKHPAIIKFQSGYKPFETIYHFVALIIIYCVGSIIIINLN